MPVYCYVCPKCGARKEVLKSIRKSDDMELCVHELSTGTNVEIMRRDIQAEHGAPREAEFPTLYSEAIGVRPEQVREHRRRHPDIPILDDGRVVITNRGEEKRILKKLGFMDRKAYY